MVSAAMIPAAKLVTGANAILQGSIDWAQCPVQIEPHRLKWHVGVLEWMAQNPGAAPKPPTLAKIWVYLLTQRKLSP